MGSSHTSIRRICQTCGKPVFELSNHVKNMHHSTITDEVASGRWKNETFYEDVSR